ncbi:MAG: acetate kinase [Candidatus Woesearchaeota archaeon]
MLISPDKYFRVCNGEVLRDIDELYESLKYMDDKIFRFHVNENKNDFANWIKYVWLEPELATKLYKTKDKQKILDILRNRKEFRILVFNAGHKSLKFKLINTRNQEAEISGIIDNIGKGNSTLTMGEIERKLSINDHVEAVNYVITSLKNVGMFNQNNFINAIAYRVAHGGEFYHEPVIVTPEVISKIKDLSEFAPLNNPPTVSVILAAMHSMPEKKHIAVFDTAFHADIPKEVFLYGLPYEFYKKYKIRKYGFHGISHKYLSRKAEELLGKTDSQIITCHLGNSSSITAIDSGQSMDTSMGFTPLDGLIMGTRSGELDPEIILYLLRTGDYTIEQLEKILYEDSGLKGITGYSDVRDLWKATQKGDKMAELALDMLCYRIARYIGGYMTILHNLDCIVFSGGIGENAHYVREKVCRALEFAGVRIDLEKNKKNETDITAKASKIKVYIIPTNEELEIATECLRFF